MPERAMTPEEMHEYLDDTHVASLVTLNEDGSPHIAPVWYRYVDGQVWIITGASAVKVRNIGRDPRVAVSIANDTSPARYVLVEGIARVTTEEADKTTAEMYVRYQGPERGPQNAKEVLAAGQAVVIVIEPTKLISWVSGVEG